MRALHLLFGATIALGGGGINECTVKAESRGQNSRQTSTSSTTRDRPTNSRGGRSNKSTSRQQQQQSQRSSVDDILDLDDTDSTSFNLDDDLDSLLGGASSSSSNNIIDDDRYDEFDYSEGDELFDPLPPYDDGLGGGVEDNNFVEDGLGETTSLMGSGGLGGDSDEYGQGSEKGALYDAYNLLHSLAQVSFVGLFIDVSQGWSTCKLSF